MTPNFTTSSQASYLLVRNHLDVQILVGREQRLEAPDRLLVLEEFQPADALADQQLEDEDRELLPLEHLLVRLLLHDPEEGLAELLPFGDVLPPLDPDLEVLGDLLDDPFFVGPLVLEVEDFLAPDDLVERRLGEEQVPLLDQRFHVAVEEGHQQGLDVGPVHVRVGHDDDLVIAELVEGGLLLPEARPQGGDHDPDLFVVVDLVLAGLPDVEDLAPQGQDGLEAPVAALLGRAAGGISLDQEDLGQGRVALLAVGQLAGKRRRIRGRSCGGRGRGPCGPRRGPGPLPGP